MGDLKSRKSIQPFLDLQEISRYGIYDFCYVNKHPPSFAKIQKKIKDSKYDQLNQFLQDLKLIFIAVSDYAFMQDPIQKVCQEFKEQIDKFGQIFLEEFKPLEPIKVKIPKLVAIAPVKMKQTVIKQQPVALPPPSRPQPMPVQQILFRERPSSLTQKLQMLFLLRANQNNQPYLRSIGTHFGIGMQVGDQYILTINDKNKSWLQVIDRN